MIYHSSHLLIIEYSCSHWRGWNIKHKSVLRKITQKVPCLCPDCRIEAEFATRSTRPKRLPRTTSAHFSGTTSRNRAHLHNLQCRLALRYRVSATKPDGHRLRRLRQRRLYNRQAIA